MFSPRRQRHAATPLLMLSCRAISLFLPLRHDMLRDAMLHAAAAADAADTL